jgi:ATP-binding cassette subfamily B protein
MQMGQGQRPRPQGGMGGFRGGPMGAMGMPVEKAKNFWPTLFRLLGYFRAQWLRLILVLLAAVIGTSFNVAGPKILSRATDKLAEGFTAKFIERIPGAGVDFTYIGQVLLLLAGLYVLSSIFSYVQQYTMAGVAQRTVYRLRRQVDEKLACLPLKFYDARTHGEILSRAVNDMDNISNTLQQNVTQLITSVVTLIGTVVLMLTISPLLTLVVAVMLPLSLLVTTVIARRSQIYFAQQQRRLGELNGHVEETYTGHKIVKAFGHEDESIARFDALNARLYEAGWRAQFVSGMILPLLNSIGNLGYVLVAVIGGIMLTKGTIKFGGLLAFIQYARQFNQPITQLASIANTIQLTLASAERIFELLDEGEESPDPADLRAAR